MRTVSFSTTCSGICRDVMRRATTTTTTPVKDFRLRLREDCAARKWTLWDLESHPHRVSTRTAVVAAVWKTLRTHVGPWRGGERGERERERERELLWAFCYDRELLRYSELQFQSSTLHTTRDQLDDNICMRNECKVCQQWVTCDSL